MINRNTVVSLYNEGFTQQQVVDSIGCHVNSVRRLMNEVGIHVRPKSRKYSLNTNYFNKIDSSEKAYWLGCLLADGTITHNSKYRTSKRLSFGLSKKDKSHVEKFRNSIMYDGPIKSIRYYDKRYQKWYVRSQVDLCSRELCDILIIGGWNSFKLTGSTAIIKTVPLHFHKHLVRGLVDGDGSISLSSKRRKLEPLFHFTDINYKVVQWVRRYLTHELELKMPEISENGNGTKKGFHFRFSDFESVKTIVSHLYCDPPSLNRKQKIVNKIKDYR
jgi:intein-encoded DNA endonuclease-like protein